MLLSLLSVFSYFLALLLLCALSWRDLKEYILPNKLNAALAITLLSFHISTQWQIIDPLSALLGALTGGGMLLIIRFAANAYYKQDALGLGDVKLMAAAGLGLGFPNIMLALSIGAFAGMLHGLVMALYLRKKTGQPQNVGQINVPAGFGLSIGIAIVMVAQFGFGWFTIK